MAVRVQTEDFDVGAESRALQAETVGGIALFVGTVRGLSSDDGVTAMTLEHFPGMTESELERIEAEARARWYAAQHGLQGENGMDLPGRGA